MPTNVIIKSNDHQKDIFTKSIFSNASIASDILGLPFDVAREQYAYAVRVGIIERSLLASAHFGRTVNLLEKLTLGPWARNVQHRETSECSEA